MTVIPLTSPMTMAACHLSLRTLNVRKTAAAILVSLLLVVAGASPTYAGVTPLISPNQLSLSVLIADYAGNSGSSWSSPYALVLGNHTLTFTLAGGGSFSRIDSGSVDDRWQGEFGAGTRLLAEESHDGPISIDFAPGVVEAAFHLRRNDPTEDAGVFKFTVFNGNTVLGTFSAVGRGSSPYFVGAHATDGDLITRITVRHIEDADDIALSPVSFLPSSINTPTGTNVTVNASNASITYAGVTAAGNTTVIPISNSTAGAPPPGFIITDTSFAFNVSTTATVTQPITLCFIVPGVTDPVAFSMRKVLHKENGVLIDRTFSFDFNTKTICAQVTSLSPFLIAQTTGPNPIDSTEYYVREHYQDFLSREPDNSGLNFWMTNIDSCATDAGCREVKRIDTSAAFFLSIEFQETGFLLYRIHKAAFGNLPGKPVPVRRNVFLADQGQIAQGVVVNAPGWEQLLESNKSAFANEFVTRPEFTALYPPQMTAAQYVDALNANAGGALSQPERDALVAGLMGSETRATVLRKVAEDSDFSRVELNPVFVLMQYFGYLQRNPDDAPEPGLNFNGYNFWLSKLTSFDGDYRRAEMVKAFISSTEYRNRFGQP